jgi:hypothetical protein
MYILIDCSAMSYSSVLYCTVLNDSIGSEHEEKTILMQYYAN